MHKTDLIWLFYSIFLDLKKKAKKISNITTLTFILDSYLRKWLGTSDWFLGWHSYWNHLEIVFSRLRHVPCAVLPKSVRLISPDTRSKFRRKKQQLFIYLFLCLFMRTHLFNVNRVYFSDFCKIEIHMSKKLEILLFI